MAKMQGDIDRAPTTVNVQVNNFTSVQVAILAALAGPPARAKVLAAIEGIEAEEPGP